MDEDLCVCAYLLPVDTQTRLEIFIHHKEYPKTSNTGHLAAKILKNSQLTLRRNKTDSEIWQMGLLEKAQSENASIYFLCHNPLGKTIAEALSLDAKENSKRKKILAVVDGTWNQAQQIIGQELGHLSPYSVKFAKLNPDPICNLWREPLPGGLATLEAIWLALLEMEPHTNLDAVKNLMMARSHRIKWVRGLLSEHEVFGGIPKKAKGKKNIAG